MLKVCVDYSKLVKVLKLFFFYKIQCFCLQNNFRSLISISDCIKWPEAYTRLSDSIFHVILMSIDENLKEAREILQRVLHRKLYRCVGETNPKQTTRKVILILRGRRNSFRLIIFNTIRGLHKSNGS